MLKIAFGMIVFQGEYVLRECLEQIYPFATQILISEGPVKFWQEKGFTTSTDMTNEILRLFPDPENKIKIIHGQFNEKDEQCNAYIKFLRDDIDYLWNVDSDEVYTNENLKKIIEVLNNEKPTSVGVRSISFYGGFEDYLTGFELAKDNFLRIFKVTKGCKWKTHRPPTIEYPFNSQIIEKHIDSDRLFRTTGAVMHHYSYVFPQQVKQKIEYYKAKVSMNKCLDNYYQTVYLPWVRSNEFERFQIERKFQGVHEFKPEFRGDCYTAQFSGRHPESIENNLINLKNKLKDSVNENNE